MWTLLLVVLVNGNTASPQPPVVVPGGYQGEFYGTRTSCEYSRNTHVANLAAAGIVAVGSCAKTSP